MGKNRQKANLTSNNLITSDITNDRIGINSTSPTTTLDVGGTVTATTIIKSGGTSSQFLKADGSVDTSTYLTSVVEDTTPQLGGNLDLNSKTINGTGNIDITGTLEVSGISTFSNEIEIYRPNTANNSYTFLDFVAGTSASDRVGFLSIYNNKFTFGAVGCDLNLAGDTPYDTVITTNAVNGSYTGNIGRTAVFTADGTAQLWYQDVKKFETTGTGVNVTGHTETDSLNVSGIATATSFSGSGSSLTGLTGASSGTYGDASNVAQVVVDANGRITGISEVAISGGGGGGASEAFKTISVSGQSDVVADSATDTLTLVAGSNMTITTNASGDSVTFASSGGGGGGSGISAGKSIALAMIFG